MNELWKMKCKADLFNLRKNEAAILSIPEEINMERERMTSIKSASTGTAPVQGGGTSYEERMNNSICLIDLLSDNLRFAEATRNGESLKCCTSTNRKTACSGFAMSSAVTTVPYGERRPARCPATAPLVTVRGKMRVFCQ